MSDRSLPAEWFQQPAMPIGGRCEVCGEVLNLLRGADCWAGRWRCLRCSLQRPGWHVTGMPPTVWTYGNQVMT